MREDQGTIVLCCCVSSCAVLRSNVLGVDWQFFAEGKNTMGNNVRGGDVWKKAGGRSSRKVDVNVG